MHFLAVTTFITFAGLFTTGSATCYTTGQAGDYGKGLDTVDGVRHACLSLQGTYYGKEGRQYCIQDSAGTKWNFELRHISGGNRQIDIDECISGMSKEAHGCWRGGHSSYWNWAYKADPNTGYCVMY
ncbi:hypothetical protein E0Z10_g9823 [Xylaria hypoxylon]|uniref:Cyanovirin-N domain-containing protein n=1 Tax=Xylaria hypoxylon TaxID=37992 RepID=A0A4Z0YI40_9PEZI|nr:hypothetical protein E0Z10_g9823 [Xylaria hypoxylon]